MQRDILTYTCAVCKRKNEFTAKSPDEIPRPSLWSSYSRNDLEIWICGNKCFGKIQPIIDRIITSGTSFIESDIATTRRIELNCEACGKIAHRSVPPPVGGCDPIRSWYHLVYPSNHRDQFPPFGRIIPNCHTACSLECAVKLLKEHSATTGNEKTEETA